MNYLLLQGNRCQIKIYTNCCPHSTDRVVAISGPVDALVDTIKQLNDVANEVSYAKFP